MSKGDIAKENFLNGYNCSQSVLLAFQEEIGLDPVTAARLASSFGGGMGRLREVCGAVSGMFMVAGILYGYEDPKAFEGKKEHYARIQQLANSFREKHGSIVCREMLGLEQKTDQPTPSKRTEEYYKKRPCGDIIKDAADLMEQYIQNHGL